MKKRVLLFARSFLAKYYADIESSIIEPIYVTLTHEEKVFLEGKGRIVSGCFEDEYESLVIADIPDNYLKTSFASDRFLNRFSLEKRCEILGKEITFWSRIFDTTTPDYLFNETVAVEIAEVMAIEAKKRAIPFYTALLGFLPNTFYWKPDPFSGRLDDMTNVMPSTDDLLKADEYIRAVTEKYNVPFYVKSFVGKNNRSFLRFVKTLYLGIKQSITEKRRSTLSTGFKYEDYRKFSFTYPVFYLRSLFHHIYDTVDSIKGKKFVYVPLHIEPEATLSYFVDNNYKQDTLVDLVLKSVKPNHYVVVKEHPQQAGLLLAPDFRELKKRYNNLVYLPASVSNYDVVPNCSAVVTLTSTAAWEALLLGKAVFVLGKIFYDQCPGAVRIKDFKELKERLREDYIVPSPEAIKLFAAKMISLFQHGCPTPIVKDPGIEDYIKSMEVLVKNHKS